MVQLVLPVTTLTGVPLLSQMTRNLLCAKWPEVTRRSKTLILVLSLRSLRTTSFSSIDGGLNAPLPRIRLTFDPSFLNAASKSGSFNSYNAAKIVPPWVSTSFKI